MILSNIQQFHYAVFLSPQMDLSMFYWLKLPDIQYNQKQPQHRGGVKANHEGTHQVHRASSGGPSGPGTGNGNRRGTDISHRTQGSKGRPGESYW